jgi:hypothetical protein
VSDVLSDDRSRAVDSVKGQCPGSFDSSIHCWTAIEDEWVPFRESPISRSTSPRSMTASDRLFVFWRKKVEGWKKIEKRDKEEITFLARPARVK